MVTAGCAGTARETPPAAQLQPAAVALAMYEGTYSLQAPARTIELRIWVGDDAKLHGELMGMGQ